MLMLTLSQFSLARHIFLSLPPCRCSEVRPHRIRYWTPINSISLPDFTSLTTTYTHLLCHFPNSLHTSLPCYTSEELPTPWLTCTVSKGLIETLPPPSCIGRTIKSMLTAARGFLLVLSAAHTLISSK